MIENWVLSYFIVTSEKNTAATDCQMCSLDKHISMVASLRYYKFIPFMKPTITPILSDEQTKGFISDHILLVIFVINGCDKSVFIYYLLSKRFI